MNDATMTCEACGEETTLEPVVRCLSCIEEHEALVRAELTTARADAEKWKADAERLAEALDEMVVNFDPNSEFDAWDAMESHDALKAHEATTEER